MSSNRIAIAMNFVRTKHPKMYIGAEKTYHTTSDVQYGSLIAGSFTPSNDEVDARFWQETGYKVGHKLDMSLPEDKAMSQKWLLIQNQIELEKQQAYADAMELEKQRALAATLAVNKPAPITTPAPQAPPLKYEAPKESGSSGAIAGLILILGGGTAMAWAASKGKK